MDENFPTGGYINIPFILKEKNQSTYDSCLYLRSCIEGLISATMSNAKEALSDSLGVCVYELFENAIRYSPLDTKIRVIVQKEAKKIIISVSNICEPDREPELFKKLDEMSKADPLEYYLAMMLKKPTDRGGGGGLGLARIYHECRAKLSAIKEESAKGLRITITAIIPLE